MKSNATFKTPFDKGALEAALAAAPDRVEDADCPYDPNDPENFWKNAIVKRAEIFKAVVLFHLLQINCNFERH